MKKTYKSKTAAVNALNKAISKVSEGFYTDDYWTPINLIRDVVDSSGFAERVTSADKYQHDSSGLVHPNVPVSKTWDYGLDILVVDTWGLPSIKKAHLHIVASGAGRTSYPLERYDVVAYIS